MDNYIALGLATAVLVLIPGPNVALIVANSLSGGFRAGVATVTGTTLGLAVQLAIVVSGFAALVELAAEIFSWLRWLGVAYLVFLGLRLWRQAPDNLGAIESQPTQFWRGCLVAMLNPKTLLFVAAFIPQFVDADGNVLAQMTVAAVVYLGVVFVGDLLWAAFAHSARRLFDKQATARNRLTGGFLVAAGIGLAIANRD